MTEPCVHAPRRIRTGPFPGKLHISVLVDSCWRCGRILRGIRDFTWEEYFWVRRYNSKDHDHDRIA